MKKNPLVKPVLKWVGGKRQLLNEILPLIDNNCTTYVEPFIGGGAVCFETQFQNVIINDYNEELINVYKVIKNNQEELISELKLHKEKNSEEYFYEVRSKDRCESYQNYTDIKRAARLIYLNKTCFNGLFRVNSSGQFNSPFGRYKNPNIVNKITIKALSDYFNNNNVVFKSGDYKEVLKNLPTNSFVYLDPPYMPISSSSSFTGYTDAGFNYNKQIELKEECIKLHKNKIKFLQSTSDCKEIRELYGKIPGFKIKTVNAKRSINSNALKRGEINEVLIYNEF